jgi:predicted DNA-binding transcriptional regulator AlpA
MGTLPNHLIHLLNEYAVAEILGVSVATVRRWRLLRQGPKYMKIGASVRYSPDSISKFINTRPTGAEPHQEVH